MTFEIWTHLFSVQFRLPIWINTIGLLDEHLTLLTRVQTYLNLRRLIITSFSCFRGKLLRILRSFQNRRRRRLYRNIGNYYNSALSLNGPYWQIFSTITYNARLMILFSFPFRFVAWGGLNSSSRVVSATVSFAYTSATQTRARFTEYNVHVSTI